MRPPLRVLFPGLSLVSTNSFSLMKIICHRNFGNEFAFTHSKDYLYYLALRVLFPGLSLVSTNSFSLMKIICHRNFGNEFAFTHSKDYLYYLAHSPLSQIFENETSPQN